jgi:phospho-N-acetylmuramoyl-pentapeptide-transferase
MLSNLIGLESIALRACLAATMNLVLALALGPRLITWLRARFREPIKSGSPELDRLHRDKASTPTMGGIFIVGGIMVCVSLFVDVTEPRVILAILVAAALAVLGACDDWIKLTTAARGLRAGQKLLGLITVGALASIALHQINATAGSGSQLSVPFSGLAVDLGWWFVPWATLVIIGSANAVNLADGLDGLAPGCLICAAAALAAVTYLVGDAQWAAYLNAPHVASASEMAVVAAALVGGLAGFLWFNCHPAAVFMGDTGSLALGGLLGMVALVARQELLLVVIGGVFVAEALSVILQVGVFRWRKIRILRCAPLHHHFQLLGWAEDKIVVRFWIVAMLCAAAGLAVLGSYPAGPAVTGHAKPTATLRR